LYDPSTGIWTTTGNMNVPREYHIACTLINGKVLVTGGSNDRNDYLNSTELYDPSTGVWITTTNMKFAREVHTASILPDGTVLVAGGFGYAGSLNSAEVY
jgi:N-acetylneuraminic acid mutarotase